MKLFWYLLLLFTVIACYKPLPEPKNSKLPVVSIIGAKTFDRKEIRQYGLSYKASSCGPRSHLALNLLYAWRCSIRGQMGNALCPRGRHKTYLPRARFARSLQRWLGQKVDRSLRCKS